MKTSITKLSKGLPAMAITAALMHSSVASAGPLIGFDPTGSGTYTTYADLWTNVTDSALVVGFDPAIHIPPSAQYDIQLLAQARVGVMSDGASVVTPLGLNPSISTTEAQCAAIGGCYELTKVTDIAERVLFNDGTNANFGFTTQTADVDGATAGLQQLAIYFDPLVSGADPGRAIPGDGAGTVSGYNDGILILSAHLIDNDSSFAASGAIGTGSFDLRYEIDFVNTNYLDVATNSIIGDKITGTTNVPTQFSPDAMWDGTLTNTGLLLKVDSSESFNSVPEPASIALMSLGLIGMNLVARRKKV